MKIFLDTAHIPSITEWARTGIIDGVTTNPTHLSKEGNDPKAQVLAICALLPTGEISVEITEIDPQAVYHQAQAIVQLAQNIIVKIPCHKDYYDIIKRLVAEGVRINVTLLFSLAQALMMCKLGVYYISPFIGRLDDTGVDGAALLTEIRCMIDEYNFTTQILAASLRSVEHVNAAIMAGADVATMPSDLLEKAVAHPLTNQGMTRFLDDWKKLNIKKFP
jgi:transaldolase